MFADLIVVILYLEKANNAKVLGITATLIEVAWVEIYIAIAHSQGLLPHSAPAEKK